MEIFILVVLTLFAVAGAVLYTLKCRKELAISETKANTARTEAETDKYRAVTERGGLLDRREAKALFELDDPKGSPGNPSAL